MNRPCQMFLGCILLVALFPTCSPQSGARAGDLADLKNQVKVPDEGKIRLPLRVHIMTKLTMNHPRNRLNCWLKPSAIKSIIEEVNLIWRQGNIEWFVESIHEHEPVAKDPQAAINFIVHSRRDSEGHADPNRRPQVHSFFDSTKHHPLIQNLYFFPFVGNTSQGFAGDPNTKSGLTSNYATVGMWSNKYAAVPYRTKIRERSRYSTAKIPPQKDNFFEVGSLGRTCAHELGHNLRLKHAKPETQQVFGRLMGGAKQSYRLTGEEIATARREALKRGKGFLHWNPASLPKQVIGRYRVKPMQNDWHEGTITAVDGKPDTYLWTNKAGISWHLKLRSEHSFFITGNDNPYVDKDPTGARHFRLVYQRKPTVRRGTYELTGFRFKSDYFERLTD